MGMVGPTKLALLVILLPRLAFAIVGDRDEAFGLDGSLRTILGASQNYAPISNSNPSDGVAQGILRLVAGGYPTELLSYELHLVHTLTMETFDSTQFLTGAFGGNVGRLPYRLVPLTVGFGESGRKDVHAQMALDRLNIKLSVDAADVTVGRQAITFGKAYFWNPLDLFLAFGSTEFDRDYKPGVDALRVDIPMGDFSGVTLVGVMGDVESDDLYRDSAWVARVFTTLADWDVALQGGKLMYGYHAGGAFSGELGTIEMRGEAAYFFVEDNLLDDHLMAVLGCGRRFENTLYLQLEHLYNGGSGDSLLESFAAVAGGRLLQASRNVTGVVATYEIFPVLFGSLAWIFEWDNQSMLLQPGLSYSAADEVDVLVGALIAVGERPSGFVLRSELGSYPNFFYTEAKIYF